ncbi:MAG: ABC transporter substrate-binding protein [Dehalococcoidia bacterium]
MTQNRLGRRRLLRAGGAFSVGAAALALIGCGSDDGDSSSSSATSGGQAKPTGGIITAAKGDPRKGGTFTRVTTGVANHSVVDNAQSGAYIYGVTTYDRPLTAKLTSDRYVLEAMEKIELIEPTKLVMTLKPNLVYQNKAPVNGRKVTGNDIKATQEYVKTNPTSYNATLQKGFLDRVEVSDDRTITYHLTQPSAYLFTGFYLGSPHSQAIIPAETLGTLKESEAIGSGPFELIEYQRDVRHFFKRFENYRDANKVYFDNREVLQIIDAIALESAFRSGQMHYWEPTGGIVSRLTSELQSPKFEHTEYLSLVFNGLTGMMNQKDGGPRPWNDIRVREAFYRLLNPQQFIDLAVGGRAVIPTGVIPAGFGPDLQLAASETAKYFKNDAAAAKQLLSAANYDSSKTWEVLISAGNSASATQAEVMQQQLGVAGIQTRPRPSPTAEFLDLISKAQYDFFLGSSTGTDSTARPLRYQHSKTGFTFGNFGLYDATVDALIEKSEIEVNAEAQANLVKEIQRKALDLYTLSRPIFTEQQTVFYDGRLQNLEIDAIYGQTYEVGAWFSA